MAGIITVDVIVTGDHDQELIHVHEAHMIVVMIAIHRPNHHLHHHKTRHNRLMLVPLQINANCIQKQKLISPEFHIHNNKQYITIKYAKLQSISFFNGHLNDE